MGHTQALVIGVLGFQPAPESIELPLSTDARQFYKTGAPFLQRHLPFWLSVLVQQVVALFIPVAGLLYPLLRISPRIFLWVASRRVYRLYSELRLLEEELASASSDKAGKDFIERLDRLEGRVSHLWVPSSLRPQLYNLRLHISMVREKAPK